MRAPRRATAFRRGLVVALLITVTVALLLLPSVLNGNSGSVRKLQAARESLRVGTRSLDTRRPHPTLSPLSRRRARTSPPSLVQWRQSKQAPVATALPPIAPSRKKPSIFYFAITHHDEKYRKRALSSDRTWGQLCCPRGLMWYSTQPDPALRNVTVLVPPKGSRYDDVYYRVLLIYQHVYEQFGGYDWYVRAWDDNFVFPDVVEEVASSYDANELLDVGYTEAGRSGDWCHSKDYNDFAISNTSLFVPCPKAFNFGGPTSLLSGAALRKLGPALFTVCPSEVIVQEDVTMAICFERLGIRVVENLAFQANSIRPRSVLPIFPSDISCRRKLVVDPKHPEGIGIAALHYVKNGDHEDIYKALVVDKCNNSREHRDEEARRIGHRVYPPGTLSFKKHVAGFTLPPDASAST